MMKAADKFYQILGLCRRAGKLASGTWAAEDSIRKGKAKLVVVSDDASEATKERISKLCKNRRVDLVIFGNKEELGSSIGQSNRAIVAITDNRFKEMILDVLPDAVKVNMGVIDEWQK